MFIYQYIDVENQQLISYKLYDFIKNKTSVFSKNLFWNYLDIDAMLRHVPELGVEIEKIVPMKITVASCIFIRPDYVSGIHIDSNLAQRFLWPVKNCQGSYTNFYDLNGNEVKMIYTANGVPYLGIDQKKEMPMIDRVELVKPIIFDSSIPHNVSVNPAFKEPRITVTIGFEEKNLERFLRV